MSSDIGLATQHSVWAAIWEQVMQLDASSKGLPGKVNGTSPATVDTQPYQQLADTWTPQQWWEAFNFLFVQAPACSRSTTLLQGAAGAAGATGATGKAQHPAEDHLDDLLFFVNMAEPQGAKLGRGTARRQPAFIVRRRQASLPPDLQLSGKLFWQVDWCDSVMLNLVLQTRYILTVVACRQSALAAVADGRDPPADEPSCRVARPVFASPTRTTINLGNSRPAAAAPVPSYPDICFAVDNFEDEFEEMMLRNRDDVYCVVLHAVLPVASGTAAPNQLGKDPPQVADRQHSTAPSTSAGQRRTGHGPPMHTALNLEQQELLGASTQHPPAGVVLARAEEAAPAAPHLLAQDQQAPPRRHVTLFSGFVSYTQVQQCMAGKNRQASPAQLLGRALHSTAGLPTTERECITMTGPCGLGRADVAVMAVPTVVAESGGGAGSDAALLQSLPPAAVAPPRRTLLQRGFAAAMSAAQQAAKALQDSAHEQDVGQPSHMGAHLQCALISLSLPTDVVARALLVALCGAFRRPCET